jgi:orotidine-5'-phosphate decarboxylase
LFKRVLQKAKTWGTPENMMFVVGATRAEDIAKVRIEAPEHFFLVPGVGAQGGSLEDVCNYGWIDDCGLLVNSSRAIIYASKGHDFAVRAGEVAAALSQEMAFILDQKGFFKKANGFF